MIWFAYAFPLLAYAFPVGQGLLGLVVLVIDIVAIVSLLNGSASSSHKALWILLILLFPFIGVIAYYLFGRSRLDG